MNSLSLTSIKKKNKQQNQTYPEAYYLKNKPVAH